MDKKSAQKGGKDAKDAKDKEAAEANEAQQNQEVFNKIRQGLCTIDLNENGVISGFLLKFTLHDTNMAGLVTNENLFKNKTLRDIESIKIIPVDKAAEPPVPFCLSASSLLEA